MAPEYSHYQQTGVQYDTKEEWECVTCFKIISSCACVNAGSLTQVPDHHPQGETFVQRDYEYQRPRTNIHFPLPSYASSSVSTPCPEGPERQVPETAANNEQPQVVVEQAVNDLHYRLSTSEPPDVSLQMWRFFAEIDHNRPGFAAELTSPNAGLLAEDFRARCQNRGSSNRRRKPSHQSIFSSSSGEHSFPGCDVDATLLVGSWDEKESYAYSGDDYPMTMSGVLENPTEE